MSIERAIERIEELARDRKRMAKANEDKNWTNWLCATNAVLAYERAAAIVREEIEGEK